MLKFYIRDGMEVNKVHEVMSFTQSKWLEFFYFQYSAKKSSCK